MMLFLLLELVIILIFSNFQPCLSLKSFPRLFCSLKLSSGLYHSSIHADNDEEVSSFNLTPQLLEYTIGLRSVSDEKIRYQQLLYLAAKCPSMDSSLKVDENLVPGCLSTVHVHATLEDDGRVSFQGDSDSQLTKGLLTLLIKGLSGEKIDDILKVDIGFVKYAGIAKSLTPGRNNGLLNMFNLIMKKTEALKSIPNADEGSKSSKRGKVYSSIMEKLALLKPVELNVVDESYKHAGHAGVDGKVDGETHFQLDIVADCFEGLSIVKRHQMIYTILAQEMDGPIHALSIRAKTPAEL